MNRILVRLAWFYGNPSSRFDVLCLKKKKMLLVFFCTSVVKSSSVKLNYYCLAIIEPFWPFSSEIFCQQGISTRGIVAHWIFLFFRQFSVNLTDGCVRKPEQIKKFCHTQTRPNGYQPPYCVQKNLNHFFFSLNA